MTELEFIKRNISSEPYQIARFGDFNDYLIKMAKKDLAIFTRRERQRSKINRPQVGDVIIRKDGTRTRIGIFTYDGNFQDTFGGSFYLGETSTSYSGGFNDVLNVKCLKRARESSELLCWIFSGDYWGANRGVYNTIKVKTWREIGKTKTLTDYLESMQEKAFKKAGAFLAHSNDEFQVKAKKGVLYVNMGLRLFCPKSEHKWLDNELNKILKKAVKQDVKENGARAIISRAYYNCESHIKNDVTDAQDCLKVYKKYCPNAFTDDFINKVFRDCHNMSVK